MRSIFLLLIGLGVVVSTVYFGIFKNNNFNDNNFQSVGEINLQGNISNSLTRDIIDVSSGKTSQTKSSSKKTKSSSKKSQTELTKVTAIIAPIVDNTNLIKIAESPSISSTATATITQEPQAQVAPILTSESEKSELVVEPITPIVAPVTSTVNSGRVVISEILVGVDGNADYEFIELYNPSSFIVDLTGWSIKKRSSSGSESTLVSNNTKYGNFKDKKILPGKYLLLAKNNGYSGNIQPDILYSGELAYKNNAVVLYNPDGKVIEDIGWDEIVKGQSLERISWSTGEFKSQTSPNPQNSLY